MSVRLLRGMAQHLFAASTAGDGTEKWSVLFPRGEYHGENLRPAGVMTFDDAMFSEMIASWDAQGKPLLPVYWHHVTHEAEVPVVDRASVFRAAGHINGFRITDLGLEARTLWSEAGKRDVEGGAYVNWSAEWQHGYQDNRTGKIVMRWCVTGAALTDIPFFQDQPRLAASAAPPTKEHPMDKKLICAALKMPEDSTDEAVLAALTAACSKASASAGLEVKLTAAAVDAEAKVTAALAPVKEALALATAAATDAKALAASKDAEIEKLKASAKAVELDTLLASMSGCGATQREAVRKYAGAMGIEEARAFAKSLTPVADLAQRGVTGTEGDDETPASAMKKLESEAAKLRASGVVNALEQAMKSNPKLALVAGKS